MLCVCVCVCGVGGGGTRSVEGLESELQGENFAERGGGGGVVEAGGVAL